MYKNKKGQAAMEFLMTYGWAILAAIVVIGVLGAYFYFKGLSPSQATVSAPFYVEAWNIGTANVQLGLKNNGGENLNVTSILINSTDYTLAYANNAVGGDLLSSGSTRDITITLVDGTPVAGDNYKGDIVIRYTKGDSAIPLTSAGSISGSIA